MGFLNKMKTAFGNSKTKEETIDSDYIQDIINSIENMPFAASQSNVLYGGINDLAGYHYFQTVVVGTLKLKTNSGAELTIIGDDFELTLTSDMLELESEDSNVTNQYVTKIDFEIEVDDIPKIVKSKIKSLEFSSKKEKIIFTMVEIIHDEAENLDEVENHDEEE